MAKTTTKHSLADLAYAQLSEMLSEHEWQKGGRLPPEEKLATGLGVSRRVLRQALDRLREEGHVVSRKGSGSYVLPPETEERVEGGIGSIQIRSLEELHACFRYRRALEVAAAGEAAERATGAMIDDIAEALEEFRSALPGRSHFDLDYKFHLEVTRASRNAFFFETVKCLKSSLRMGHGVSRNLRSVPLSESIRVYEEHSRVLRAIKTRDPAAARAAMDAHIGAGIDRLFGAPVEGLPGIKHKGDATTMARPEPARSRRRNRD